MGGFSLWHWIIVLFWVVLAGVPMWRISSKAGFPGVFGLLMFIPLVNLLLLWIFAFVKWPVENGRIN